MADFFGILSGLQVQVSSAFPNKGQSVLRHSGAYYLYAVAYQLPDLVLGVSGELPVPVLHAVGGAQTKKMVLPSLEFTASGTVTQLGRTAANLPALTLTASGTVTQQGRAELFYSGTYLLRTCSGAVAQATLPQVRGSLVAHGLSGKVGGVGAPLPSLTLTAGGKQHAVGKLAVTLPALRFVPSGTLRESVYLPRFTLFAVGRPSAVSQYEAYSVSLLSDQREQEQAYVTHYTDYPFEQIVRFGTKYFGVAKTGLFELTGDRFDTEPIIAFIRTGETDYGSRQVKRPVSLYIAGRLRGDFVAAVTPAELKDYDYHYHTFDKTGARNYRVLFGKGLRARYLAYTFTNLNGEAFDLDEITPEVAELRRTA